MLALRFSCTFLHPKPILSSHAAFATNDFQTSLPPLPDDSEQNHPAASNLVRNVQLWFVTKDALLN